MIKSISKYTFLFPFIAVAFSFFSCKYEPSEGKKGRTRGKFETKVIYGLNLADYTYKTDLIGKNEHLSGILGRIGVPFEIIDRLVKKSEGVFDVKKIRVGKKYTVLSDKRPFKKARYFVYEINAVDYAVFELTDSVDVYLGSKPITLEIKRSSGTIEHSLYADMQKNDDPIELAAGLADVFAWQINFFQLQKGDRYRAVYEERKVDGESVGIGKVLGAVFEQSGKKYTAVYFKNDSTEGYYDEEGRSLRKQFLKAPLNFTRISSRFSLKRFHPVQKRYKAHLGTDYAAARGTPIRAVGDGTVSRAGYSGGNGRFVKIMHNSVYSTQYLHMSKFAAGMKVGKKVQQGEVIGYVGSTGLATGPHLCFRFWKNGKQVDPLSIKMSPSEPLKEAYMEEFNQVKNRVLEKISKKKITETQLVSKN